MRGAGSHGRVAVVHDWLTGMRGGEKVLESILDLYPQADVFTLVYHRDRVSDRIRARRVTSSWIDRLPFSRRRHQIYLPLFPAAIGSLDLGAYDLVISTSHCVAKGAIVRPGTPHVCYCHTPMRYIWDFREVYFGHIRPAPVKWLVDGILEGLRLWDTVPRVDHWIANSRTVAKRIARYYGRPATVIHPPVDVEAFHPVAHPTADYFVVLSAFVPYKRLDLAVEAANRLRVPLKIVGDGAEAPALKRLAGPTVEFVGRASTERIRELLAHARALLFPGEEDFGITPLEANACGRPVVAYRAGGATESMIDGVTAVFFDEQTVDSLCAAMQAVTRLEVDPQALRSNALRFSEERFRREFVAFMQERVGSGPAELARVEVR
jgi:glycosyltransferase involved in cell wall biosynthesis